MPCWAANPRHRAHEPKTLIPPTRPTQPGPPATHPRWRCTRGTAPRRPPPSARRPAVVQAAADGDDAVYGVNTGFGKLANQRISKERPRHPAAEPDPLAQRGRGRATGRAHHASDDGDQGRQPGTRLLGRARGRGRHPAGRGQRRAWCPLCPARARWAPRATWRRCRT